MQQFVNIQIQDRNGNWLTVTRALNNDRVIKLTVDTAIKTYQRRARAVDDNGNILDLR
jgi:hypothetical protein